MEGDNEHFEEAAGFSNLEPENLEIGDISDRRGSEHISNQDIVEHIHQAVSKDEPEHHNLGSNDDNESTEEQLGRAGAEEIARETSEQANEAEDDDKGHQEHGNQNIEHQDNNEDNQGRSLNQENHEPQEQEEAELPVINVHYHREDNTGDEEKIDSHKGEENEGGNTEQVHEAKGERDQHVMVEENQEEDRSKEAVTPHQQTTDHPDQGENLKESPVQHEEAPQPEQPTKGRRGRKAKADKNAEPQLGKRQELSVPKASKKNARKASEDSNQPSMVSERGTYSPKHDLAYLGEEIHRSENSVIYYSTGPIDPDHFGPCIIKHRLPKKVKAKQTEKTSLNMLKQEVNGLTRARNLGVPVPAVFAYNLQQRLICLEFLKNHINLGEYLNSKADDYDEDTINEMRKLFTKIGSMVAELHNGNLIHGDLSVSTVFVDQVKLNVRFISFGLSSTSTSIEDKSVDLFRLFRSFPATHEEHMRYSDLTNCLYTGYTSKSAKVDAVVQRLQKIKQKFKDAAH